jgi:hypothetical protein
VLLEMPSSGFIAPRNASGCSVIEEPGVVQTFVILLEFFVYHSSLDEESELDSDLSSTSQFIEITHENIISVLVILIDLATPQIVYYFAIS